MHANLPYHSDSNNNHQFKHPLTNFIFQGHNTHAITVEIIQQKVSTCAFLDCSTNDQPPSVEHSLSNFHFLSWCLCSTNCVAVLTTVTGLFVFAVIPSVFGTHYCSVGCCLVVPSLAWGSRVLLCPVSTHPVLSTVLSTNPSLCELGMHCYLLV